MKVFAIVGTSEQIIDNSSNAICPKGSIQMQCLRPSDKHIAQADGTWDYPLELAKEQKWLEIKSARDQQEQAGLPYMGKMLDNDAISVQRITTAVQAAQLALSQGQQFNIDWTTQDNSTITMTAVEVCGIPLELAKYSNQIHTKARDLKEIIDNALTQEEVEQVMWNKQ